MVVGILAGVPAGLIYTFFVALASAALTKNHHAPVVIAAQLVPFGLCFYFAVREVRRGTPFGAFLLAFGVAALLPTAACDVWLSSVSW
ncbi:MAG: hypothetical protein IAI48_01520 [Candidatus Eremiobacteraeota bacterium]|nr:hypothetical protein [Candidatus Eremiobacteraeota bacterium]